MIIQIEIVGACAIVTACVSLCWLIMRLSLRPTEQRLDRHEKILEQVKGPEDLSNLIARHVNFHASTCPKGAAGGGERQRASHPASVSAGGVVVALAIAFLLALFCACATITPTYDETGRVAKVESAKFLSDLSYEEEFEFSPDGKALIRHRIKYATATTADKLLNSVTSFLGTLIEGASKVAP